MNDFQFSRFRVDLGVDEVVVIASEVVARSP